MSRNLIFVLTAFGLLSACGGQLGGPPPQPALSDAYSSSIGFTGVGREAY